MPTEKEIIINDFIKEIIRTNRKCNHCMNCHYPNSDETFCFFAYACLTQDFDYFKEDDD